MSYVNILKLNDDGSQKIIAVCRLTNEKIVTIEGESWITDQLKAGIEDYSDPTNHKPLKPETGLKFLEQLKYNFKSGYLNATDIIEE